MTQPQPPQSWNDIAGRPQQYGPPPAYPPAAKPARTGAWVALAAGAVAILGSLFLPWVSISAPLVGSITLYGTEGDGWITAAAAAVPLVYGIIALRRDPGLVFQVFAIVGALAVACLGGWKVFDLIMRESAMRTEMAAGPDTLGLQEAFSDATQVQIGIGLWALVFAGLVGAGAIAREVWRR